MRARAVILRGASFRHLPMAAIGVFLLTRLAMAILAGNPQWYTGSGLPATPYVYGSRDWALQIMALGQVPYAGAPIEYPPGLLPFILGPALLLRAARIPYLPTFVALMTVVDAVGFLGIWRLSIRLGSSVGLWVWVIGIPLLGPMVLLRLDLVPAVATIWSLERISAGAPGLAGAILGFGTIAKLYPALLLPSALALIQRRGRFVIGMFVTIGLTLVPFVPVLDDVVRSVAGFHLGRGVQLESSWGTSLLLSDLLGSDAEITRAFGSWDVVTALSSSLEVLSSILSVGVVLGLAWIARRMAPDDSGRSLALVWFATIACLLVTGRVLSPQYLIWAVALAAAGGCSRGGLSMRTVVALLASAVLTQVEFPFLFQGAIDVEPISVLVLTARNACLAFVAASAVIDVVRTARARPSEWAADRIGGSADTLTVEH